MGGSTDKVAGVGRAESSTTTEASSSSGRGTGRSSTGTRTRERMKSLVEDQGVYRSTCGYCKATSRSSVAQGLWAHSLMVQDYQDLLDRGWRRSGMFLYKPCMKSTCCPPYTIRLKAESFVANKDQIRVLRRMRRYLDGELEGPQTVKELSKEKDHMTDRTKGLPNDIHVASVSDRNAPSYERSPIDIRPVAMKDVSETSVTEEEDMLGMLRAAIDASLRSCVESGLLPLLLELPTVSVKRVSQKIKNKLKNVEEEVDYTSNIAFAVVAHLKRMSKCEVLPGDADLKEQQAVIADLEPQKVADILITKLPDLSDPRGVSAKASKGHLNFVVPDSKASSSRLLTQERQALPVNVEKRNQTCNKNPLQALDTTVAKPSASVRQLEIRMKRSSFDAEEYALYKKYQVRVHNDCPADVKESSYRRFLVDTPLSFVPPANDGTTPSCGFGSFHQQYLIDGRLVAVGVIDILPHCLSSKYLFWDPDFAFLSLGKYSALQEIKWVQEAQKVCPSLVHYYLGFYIHSCPKMRYKASYYPSELLCPERFSWVAYDSAVPFLDKQPYVSSSDIVTTRLMSPGPSNPAIVREQDSSLSTELDDENSQNDMEEEVDFSHIEDQENMNGGFGPLLEKDGGQAVDGSMEQLGDIQLYLKGVCLPFKHLQELGLVPKSHLESLIKRLQGYLQVVGTSLAARMAYVLS